MPAVAEAIATAIWRSIDVTYAEASRAAESVLEWLRQNTSALTSEDS